MHSSRRDFLQRSASAAAALSLGPLASDAAVGALEAVPAGASASASSRVAENPAAIRAFEARLLRARPVPLERVRLTGGPLKQVQDVNAKYLLELQPDRMLAYYRERAGLQKKAEPYGGWDGGGRNLTGHIAGHYLSAVALMYRATGDARMKERVDYIVRELDEVQKKNGDGYLGALEGAREAFAAVSKGDIRSGGFDLNGLWAPWYTLHKTYAGLRDAYRHAGNRTALALETRFAEWAEKVVAPMSDAQVQKMLLTEFGGMGEVLADLYADTGDRRWLALSHRFEHHGFMDPLKRHQDNLAGKHANTNIPKLIGSAARYGYTGDPDDIVASAFFWDRVVQHHTYATGGHGLAEYWGPPDVLGARVDGRTCEACNAYNMLKLTRRLFSFRPDAPYADFQERLQFNQVLASINPADGRTSYMVPVGRGVQQEYQDMQRSFTCCVGSGMENHAMHADGIYYESDDTVWVNMFAPSTAQLSLGGVRVEQTTDFPDGGTATLALSMPRARAFTLAVRRPTWAGDGFVVKVNGEPVPQPTLASLRASGGGRASAAEEATAQPGTYVELTRTWKSGDRVELTLPKSLHLEPTPDDRSVAAILWGPLVLAADLGPRREGRQRAPDGSATLPPPAATPPVLVAAGRPVTEWVAPAGARPGDFRAVQVARVPTADGGGATGDVALAPYWRTHERRYSAYFDILTPAQFAERSAAIAAEREKARRLEAATVAFVQPGEMQPERDFNYQSEPLERPVLRAAGRANRAGAGWFSFELPVDASADSAVVVTYLNDLGLPPASGEFEILVDGTRVGRFEPNASARGFFDVVYPVPASVVRGKGKVTVRFQASPGGRVAPVFGVRTVRAKDL